MAEDLTKVQYSFITGQVPRYDVNEPDGLNLVKQQLPVILTGSDLVAPAMKWNLEYLNEHLGPGPYTVFINSASSSLDRNSNGLSIGETNSQSPVSSDVQHKKLKPSATCHHLFKYYDQKKAEEYVGQFVPAIRREELSFDGFVERFKGDRDKERVYLQQPLNNTVGKQIATDFVKFNWPWNVKMSNEWAWGPLTSNLLLIGQKGNVTPCHYDEQQNLFCQLQGQKRFLLFAPENFPNLYPYPVHHPHDRQSQVNFDNPDVHRFPKFCDLKGVEAVLNPGEILYIPMYWWHHVINSEDTIAINFWHKDGTINANTPIEYPLKSHQKVAMVRNIEKMLLQALKDQNELDTMLHWLVDGRF